MVGYGYEGADVAGKRYWIVKNRYDLAYFWLMMHKFDLNNLKLQALFCIFIFSWTEKWGDKGYIYMAKDRKNHCGIATSGSYPLV